MQSRSPRAGMAAHRLAGRFCHGCQGKPWQFASYLPGKADILTALPFPAASVNTAILPRMCTAFYAAKGGSVLYRRAQRLTFAVIATASVARREAIQWQSPIFPLDRHGRQSGLAMTGTAAGESKPGLAGMKPSLSHGAGRRLAEGLALRASCVYLLFTLIFPEGCDLFAGAVPLI
jgi:hypothetical protein